MKTNLLPVIAFLAALAAFVLLPISTVAATVALSVTGMISVFAADYGRRAAPLRVPAPVVPMNLSRMAAENQEAA
jgi:hypothetical protein